MSLISLRNSIFNGDTIFFSSLYELYKESIRLKKGIVFFLNEKFLFYENI